MSHATTQSGYNYGLRLKALCRKRVNVAADRFEHRSAKRCGQ